MNASVGDLSLVQLVLALPARITAKKCADVADAGNSGLDVLLYALDRCWIHAEVLVAHELAIELVGHLLLVTELALQVDGESIGCQRAAPASSTSLNAMI